MSLNTSAKGFLKATKASLRTLETDSQMSSSHADMDEDEQLQMAVAASLYIHPTQFNLFKVVIIVRSMCRSSSQGTIRKSRNADVLPGLGTAILRTPQPRQTLACLHRRDPRKGCSTRARINHLCAVDAITYGLLPEGILAVHHPSVVGLTPDSSIVTSHRQVRDNSVVLPRWKFPVLSLSQSVGSEEFGSW
ncbi:hypothetical protein PROFUN_03011 [Planoprotostelium fungivorum]|uniref:Uncharacterized protein n=1 Tax=Planoprotostelium fungivorum TaxID=1890364 RepID=A0A2P6NXA9_9EUKA|nr:hypothetical protein PROFUN_03011 [Planoprotostelium fungivorum]